MEKTTNFHLNLPTPDEYFDVEHQNENFRKIDDALQEEKAKIGDVKITTKEITDPSWLLCSNTHITEADYPELYNIVSAQTDIFKGEWYSATVQNGGIAPIYSSDGYIYFVSNNATTASRCKPDFTEFETFTMLNTGYLKYENGYWFAFKSGDDFGTVYYSSDCFKTDTHTLSLSASGSYKSASYSFVRYTGGKWYIGFVINSDKSIVTLYQAASIEGPYSTSIEGFYAPSGYTRSQLVEFKNGTAFGVFYDSYTSGGVTLEYLYAKYNPKGAADSDTWVSIGKVADYSDGFPIMYIEQLDAVIYWAYENNYPRLMRNDGTTRSFNISATSIAYFKGFLYLKTSSSIVRYDVNDFAAGGVKSTEYVTDYAISASPDRIYMPKSESKMYYIENPADITIPETHPGTIFKTYIKAKRGDQICLS